MPNEKNTCKWNELLYLEENKGPQGEIVDNFVLHRTEVCSDFWNWPTSPVKDSKRCSSAVSLQIRISERKRETEGSGQSEHSWTGILHLVVYYRFRNNASLS